MDYVLLSFNQAGTEMIESILQSCDCSTMGILLMYIMSCRAVLNGFV